MADVKWIKIVTDIFDDEKMLLIESLPDADSIIVCWFKLLCLAGKQNNSGVMLLNDRIPYTDEMIATVFRRPVQTVRLALKTFEQFGMIEIIQGVITIPNWGKHQNLEGIERVREQTRERVQRYRERQKLLTAESNVTNNDTVTESNGTDIEEDKIRKDKNKKFVPPTLEEVKAYIQENGYNVDANYFFDYYSKGNWIDGQGKPVRNWKQKLITWAKKDAEKAPQKKPNAKGDFTPNKTIDADALRQLRELSQSWGNRSNAVG